MQVRIKRFDPTLPLPVYHSPGAACLDLCAREETTIASHSVGYIPLNIALEIPEGYWVLLSPRGSTHKAGLLPANGIGVMDQDFCGDQDEYLFFAYNYTDQPATVKRGQRIAQCTLLRREEIELVEVAHLGNANRGKLGSTGKH